MVITDGRSDEATITWENAVKIRTEREVFMLALGIGDNIRPLELEGIASGPSNVMVYRVEDFDESLEESRLPILALICNST